VASHQADDEDALESVAFSGTDSEQYRPALHRFLTRRLQNAEDARDLAQETYLRFYQLPDMDAVRRPSGYLFRIAVNLVYEFRLKRSRERVAYDSDVAESLAENAPAPAATDPAQRLATRDELTRILAQIPATYRRVFILHKRDGYSCQEIAAALNLAPRSVEVYLARAIAFARNARWT
jgi:RNA polymerase sigma factor (sigma-70 family)